MRIGSTNYAVLEVITINDLTVPVLDIPMMKDKKKRQMKNKERQLVKDKERRRHISIDVLNKAQELQMTDRQREIWNLYTTGGTIKSIAERLGRSTGTIGNTISRILLKLQDQRCQYSEDCFSCPLPDCVLTSRKASVTNLLPTDKFTTLTLWRK